MSATINDKSLNIQDIVRLSKDPSDDMRAIIAGKIGHHITQVPDSDSEYRLALEIANIFLKDSSPKVRFALADEVKESNAVPKSMVLSLANDEDPAVASPVLEYSSQLSEEDILNIIHTTEKVIKLISLARRRGVALKIVDALIDKKLDEVNRTLIENDTSEMTDNSFNRIIEDFGHEPDLVKSFMRRTPVPAKAVKRMVERATESGRRHLESSRRVLEAEVKTEAQYAEHSPAEISALSEIIALGADPDRAQCMRLAEELNRSGALSPSLLAAVLLLGNRGLYVACMTLRSRLPVDEVEKLFDGSDRDFKQIYQKAHLPFGILKLFVHLKNECLGLEEEGLEVNSEAYFEKAKEAVRQAVIERIPYANKVGIGAVKLVEGLFGREDDDPALAATSE